MPGLGKHGLAFTAWPGTSTDGHLVLDYALTHESGEERTGQYPLWLMLPERVTAQLVGGLITYARRYCLCAVTGVAPGGEDNDGAATAEVEVDRPQRTRAKIPGPSHERLRHGTVVGTPDDQIADRGPLPPADDLWRDQPPGEFNATPPEERAGSVDGRQRSQIFAKFKILGVTKADAQREILTDILHREVSSRAGLSYVDAQAVLADLDARIEAKEAAETAAAQDADAEQVTP
jgi:hypothetical protein